MILITLFVIVFLFFMIENDIVVHKVAAQAL